MRLNTHLLSGAGNTFHISYFNEANHFINNYKETELKTFANQICLKHEADGMIFLQPSTNDHEYSWNFYNNDGSNAEMCGNATRCVGYYLKNILNSTVNTWNLQTIAGLIKIEAIENTNFKITMTQIELLISSLGFYCDTGVPHLVLEKNEIVINDELKTTAKNLRLHKEFQPKGTNVTYLSIGNNNCVKAVSYERGVEGFTNACGTGAMAAAFYNLTKRGVQQTLVEMPGGTLNMDLSDLKHPTMTGPAVLLGSYTHEI